jgi:SAM-dependent methyltransferase
MQGHFPADVPVGWGKFDVITFHDVFEHLADPHRILGACRARLARGGVLVLSLPSARGFVYRLGKLLYRGGWRRPLERMFQVNYPYPHLFYFTMKALRQLAEANGLEVAGAGRIDGLAVRGSLHRARLDESAPGVGTLEQYATALGLAAIALVQRALPPDNIYVILRPRER